MQNDKIQDRIKKILPLRCSSRRFSESTKRNIVQARRAVHIPAANPRTDAIANLPTSQTIFLTSLKPCACEATCSDSDEPSTRPVVLQLAKRFPRHRIRTAILGHGQEGRDSPLTPYERRYSVNVPSTSGDSCCARRWTNIFLQDQ